MMLGPAHASGPSSALPMLQALLLGTVPILFPQPPTSPHSQALHLIPISCFQKAPSDSLHYTLPPPPLWVPSAHTLQSLPKVHLT